MGEGLVTHIERSDDVDVDLAVRQWQAYVDALHAAGWTTTEVDAADELVCQGCGNAYPVRDDIPVLLVDEARKPA